MQWVKKKYLYLGAESNLVDQYLYYLFICLFIYLLMVRVSTVYFRLHVVHRTFEIMVVK
jgi:hypothetical protein